MQLEERYYSVSEHLRPTLLPKLADILWIHASSSRTPAFAVNTDNCTIHNALDASSQDDDILTVKSLPVPPGLLNRLLFAVELLVKSL